MTRERIEIVIEGTHDPEGKTGWQEYEFRGKPGDAYHRPCQFAPYHSRLDWLMRFAALSPVYAEPWFPRLVRRLLEGDPAALRLLRHNPFPEEPSVVLRARRYRYRLTTWAESRRYRAWWNREPAGDFLRPVTHADLPAER
ncbi:MAG: lipase maturation factor family protein [Aeromicrobium sp.]